ncbi:Subtilisin-like protease, partial [Thalictrum thalictroides]
MRLSALSSFLFLFLVIFFVSLLQKPVFAAKRSYVVYMGEHSHGPEVTQFDIDQVKESHCDLLNSFLGSSESAKEAIFYSYTRHINGFAAFLEEEEAEAIQKHPKVVSVFLNKGRKLHTTRSWNFLGLEKDNGFIPANSIWKKARFGEDTIIGNLDT